MNVLLGIFVLILMWNVTAWAVKGLRPLWFQLLACPFGRSVRWVLREPFKALFGIALLAWVVWLAVYLWPAPVYLIDKDGNHVAIGSSYRHLGPRYFYESAHRATGEVEQVGGGMKLVVNHECWIAKDGTLVFRDGRIAWTYPRADDAIQTTNRSIR